MESTDHATRQEAEVEIYDEVTEDQYKSIVKGRLQRDDFVVDDGAEGYVDNGMDDWVGGDEEMDRQDSDEEEQRKSTRLSLSFPLFLTAVKARRKNQRQVVRNPNRSHPNHLYLPSALIVQQFLRPRKKILCHPSWVLWTALRQTLCQSELLVNANLRLPTIRTRRIPLNTFISHIDRNPHIVIHLRMDLSTISKLPLATMRS